MWCTDLEYLNVSSCYLTELNVSENPNLKKEQAARSQSATKGQII